MSFTLLTPILIILISALAVINAVIGYKKGMMHAAINFGCAAVSVFVAALISVLVGIISKEEIIEYLKRLGMDIIDVDYGIFIEVVKIIAVMLFCAAVFILIFLGVFILAKVIVSMVRKHKEIYPNASEDTYLSENATFFAKNDKRFGAFIGALCGIFISIAVLSPVTGVLRSVPSFIGITESLTAKTGFTAYGELYEASEYASDFMVVTVDALGGGMIFDMTTTTLCYGELTNVSSEIRAIERIDFEGIVRSMDKIASYDEDSLSRFQEILDSAEDSVFVRVMILTGIRNMANSWLDEKAYLGVERPDLESGSAIHAFVDNVLEVVSTSTLDTMSDDLKSLIMVCNIVDQYSGVLANGSYETIIDTIISGNMTDRLRNAIKTNSRMASLEESADDIIIRIVAAELNTYTATARKDMFEQIAKAMKETAPIVNMDSRIDALSEKIGNAFSGRGLYTTDKLTEKISEELISEFADYISSVSYFQIKDYFDSKLG